MWHVCVPLPSCRIYKACAEQTCSFAICPDWGCSPLRRQGGDLLVWAHRAPLVRNCHSFGPRPCHNVCTAQTFVSRDGRQSRLSRYNVPKVAVNLGPIGAGDFFLPSKGKSWHRCLIAKAGIGIFDDVFLRASTACIRTPLTGGCARFGMCRRPFALIRTATS